MPQSFLRFVDTTPGKRNLKKVPFVELFDGRVQGVASSGSDDSRVYVSWIAGQTGNFSCSTNNNRPCGGLGGSPCKHIQAVLDNAVAQYGVAQVARFLGVDEQAASNAWQVCSNLQGTYVKEPAGQVFARFLDYLRYMELPPSTEPTPELAWFVTGS
jgi:hypothetical protein